MVNYMKKSKIALYSVILHIIFIFVFTIVVVRNTTLVDDKEIKSIAAGSNMLLANNELKNSYLLRKLVPNSIAVAPVSLVKTPMEIYDEMSIEEREESLRNGTLHMEYSAYYTASWNRLSVSRGAQYFNGHRETYYSEKVLPGTSLNIPGRHVADDGTIRDGDGFICVAADPSYYPRHSTLITSLGPAKVYDTGCDYGTIDIYVNW